MGNISIGGYTLGHNPSTMTIVRPDKSCASVETYSSAAFFNWGASIAGKQIELTWTWMETDEFETIDALYSGEGPLVFDPQNNTGKTYNVEIKRFDGEYFHTIDASTGLRQNVEMTLLILSEVT